MPITNTSRYQTALDAAVDAAREAGKLIRDDFHRPGGPRGSGGHAEVDEEAEQVIRQKILAAFPAAYRGEETGTASGGDGEHTWLVDPNDGTSAYLKGWRGSAVSIALVRKGVLVLGVVYAPSYPDDNGDMFAWGEGCGPLTRNGNPVTTSLADKGLNGSDDVPAIVYISQDADKNPAGNATCVAPARFIGMPSIAYLHWYNSPPFDIGGTTSSALRGAKDGQTPQERLAGAKQHASTSSQANGSLMRISPLGIFGAGNPTAAADWARADSSLTHPHQVCQDSCAVFVAAIATAITAGCSAEACYQAALDEARRSSVVAPVAEALREAAERPPEDYQTQQGWVLIALQNAFYQLLHAPSLEEGVVRTVMAGGDTDTNAAIAGALLGAVHRRDAIPPQWLPSILSCRPLPKFGTSHPRPVEFWPVDALRLAERLLVLGVGP
jgi:hypothetical protein